MFLLDTNVISELRKAGSNQCNPQVENWASATSGEQSFLSVITVFELERGVLVMERRDPVQGAMLRQWLDNHVLANYAERIVPVSVGIARRCASLHVP
ncbi:MAG: PIN domain-containing protein, partial [Cyanobacteria bacterium P01_G01_bin.38]